MRTPGPWKIKATGYPVPFDSFTIKGPDGRSIVACANSVKRGAAEKKSNAQLIVAAGDLLAMLIEVLPDLDHYANTHGTGPDIRLAKTRKLIRRVNADF